MSHSGSEEAHDSVALEQHPESPTGSWKFGDYLVRNWRETCRQDNLKKLETDRLRSRPEEQFHDEVKEEETWLNDIIGKRDGNPLLARKTVMKRWIDQGIWRDEFRFSGPSKWKHEDPACMEPKCETEVDGNAFSLPREETKSAETERAKGVEVDAQRERELDASRPFHRFIYQVLVDREKLLETYATPIEFKLSPKDPSEDSEEGLKAYYQALAPEIAEKKYQHLPHLSSLASSTVKYKWEKRGIWDEAWEGKMPDMSWKHERPLETLIREAWLDEDTEPDSPQGVDSTPSTFRSVSYDDTDPGVRV